MKYRIVITLYTLVLGLIPVLWFRSGELITGTDVNFPPFPIERLIDRSYTWNPLLFAGAERSIDISSLPYTSIPGILNMFIDDVVLVEKLSYVFMFTLTGFSINYLLESLFKDKTEQEKFFIKMFGILFYMVNFYNVFVWVRLQTVVTTLTYTPILFGVLHSIVERNVLKSKDLVLLSLVTLYAGPLGKQPPIIYVILIAVITYIVFYLLFDIFDFTKKFLPKVKKLFYVSMVSLVCIIYWAFPLGNYIFRSGLIQGADSGKEVYNVEELLSWTSKVTSNLNVIRSYGDVVWFDSWGNQYYFPEFVEFYNNNFFTLLGFLVPLLVFFSIYINKENKRFIVAFGIITLMSLFFSKGMHPPFSSLFEWSFNNLPGFWIHRAPWQKFGLVTTLGYAVLGSYGAYYFLTFLYQKCKIPKFVTAFFLLTVYLVIHALFITGKMFPSKDSDIGYHGFFNLGFHHKFPDYLYEARNFINRPNSEENYNILLLPKLHTSVYEWGYAGATDIVSSFLRRSTLSPQFGEGYALDGYISNVYNDIVSALYSNNVVGLFNAFNLYNIDYILQRNAFVYNFYGDGDSPEFIKNKLNNLGLHSPTTFGSWDFYSTDEQNATRLIYAANRYLDVSALGSNILYPILSSDIRNKVLLEDDSASLDFEEVYLSASGEFIDPNFTDETNLSVDSLPEANVRPDSILFPLVRLKENLQKFATKTEVGKVEILLWHAKKREVELSKYPDLSDASVVGLYNTYLSLMGDFTKILSENPDTPNILGFVGGGLDSISGLESLLDSKVDLSLVEKHRQELETIKASLVSDTPNCFGYCYTFNVTMPGDYEIALMESTYRGLSLSEYEVSFPTAELIRPGVYKIESGEHLVALEGPRLELLPVPDISKMSLDQFVQEIGEVRAEDLLRGLSINAVTKYSYTPKDFNSRYLIDLAYTSDGATGFVVTQSLDGGKTRSVLYSNVLVSSPTLTQFEQEVSVSNGGTSLDLYFYNLEGISPQILRMYVSRIFNPNIVLKLSGETPNETLAVPEISFKKIDPTKYLVEIDSSSINDNFVLVMNQTFSPHWKIYSGVGERKDLGMLNAFETFKLPEVSQEQHFKSNYFGNAWLIDKEEVANTDYFIVEFSTQRVFYVAAVISMSTLLILGTALVFRKER